MALFKGSMYFSFRGVNSKDMNIAIVNIGGDDTPGLFGLNRESVEVENGTNILTYKGVKNNYIDFELQLTKIDHRGDMLPFTNQDEFELKRLLFGGQGYQSLVINGIEHKVLVTGIDDYIIFNGHTKGYLNVKFRALPYCFQLTTSTIHTIKGVKELELPIKTNVDELTYPKITFNIASGNSIKITNLRTGEIMQLNNLSANTDYEINCNQKQIINLTNTEEDCYSKNVTKKFTSFVYGNNKLKIECNGRVKIEYKVKLCY